MRRSSYFSYVGQASGANTGRHVHEFKCHTVGLVILNIPGRGIEPTALVQVWHQVQRREVRSVEVQKESTVRHASHNDRTQLWVHLSPVCVDDVCHIVQPYVHTKSYTRSNETNAYNDGSGNTCQLEIDHPPPAEHPEMSTSAPNSIPSRSSSVCIRLRRISNPSKWSILPLCSTTASPAYDPPSQ